ncbi:MAG: ATP-binding cassette domain-containing protein [Pseudonocardiaceae bacterium]|nr:ATP-binding cassette domain-containing protein [Pseudonocardiaceae bacterium]
MDSRSSARFLWSLLRARWGLATCSALAGALWLLCPAVIPLAIGGAIDDGVATRDAGALLGWVAIILTLGVLQAAAGAAQSWTAHTLWVHGAYATQDAVIRHAADLGSTLPKRLRAGEVVAMSTDDIDSVGNLFEVFGRMIGAVMSFAVLAVALLHQSILLGTVALVGVPIAVLGIGPILRPLQRRKETQRDRLSEVNSMGSDIVGGLRVLRGIGGEQSFLARFRGASRQVADAGINVGRAESWLAAAEVALPGLVTLIVTVLGAKLAIDGTISVGVLVAFYGASAFLVIPVQTATEAAEAYSAAMVAAGRASKLLRMRSEFPQPAAPEPLPEGALSLADGTLRIPAGKLTVLPPDRARAERLTGFAHGEVTVAGIPIDHIDRDELRRRVVLVLSDALWFSGPVGDELALGSALPVEWAVHAACAEDVIAGFPDGLREVISERGRSVSGGQRQRLLLARALTLDPDVLVLDEPTASVDAHTEQRIAERVAELRAGRTTVVFTSSPLWRVVAEHVPEHENGDAR